MTPDRHIRLGRQGEAIARQHLEAHGFRILAQNWRIRSGEIDLVTEEGEVIVFVEVKARSGHAFGLPEESITPAKRRRLIRTAQAWLRSAGRMGAMWRIDVIAIDIDSRGNLQRLDHYPDAIGGD